MSKIKLGILSTCFICLFPIQSYTKEVEKITVTTPKETVTQVSPSHVFQKSELILEEIEILRTALAIDDEPYAPEFSAGKDPIHVYSKGLEVLEKVARAQRKMGITPIAKVGEIPLKEIKAKDVLGLTENILNELHRIKKNLVLKDQAKKVEFVGGKLPSDVYQNLWLASYMLDALTKPLKPTDVYRNFQYIQDELQLIGAKLKVSLSLEAPAVEGRKTPKNVAQQALLGLYKIVNLQTQLKMDSSGVPEITLVRIRPSDVYDITNMILAELVRIKVHLKIDLPRGQRKLGSKKTPSDAFSQALLVNDNVTTLLKR